VNRREPDPPPRGDPHGRCGGVFAADGADEEGTLERLKSLRCELLDAKHHGRIVKTTGDGMLVEFASVVDAVRCAVAVQQAMPERNTGVGPDSLIEHVEAALRLSPRARVGVSSPGRIGGAYFYSRRFDEAVPKLLLAIQEDASFPQPYRILAACYAHWVGSTTRERSLRACGRSPVS
jgi:hypothetical protein